MRLARATLALLFLPGCTVVNGPVTAPVADAPQVIRDEIELCRRVGDGWYGPPAVSCRRRTVELRDWPQ